MRGCKIKDKSKKIKVNSQIQDLSKKPFVSFVKAFEYLCGKI
jgi:ABC-type Zn2+ transport system substrate-binding protein/surface adhesin